MTSALRQALPRACGLPAPVEASPRSVRTLASQFEGTIRHAYHSAAAIADVMQASAHALRNRGCATAGRRSCVGLRYCSCVDLRYCFTAHAKSA